MHEYLIMIWKLNQLPVVKNMSVRKAQPFVTTTINYHARPLNAWNQ